jgi:type II secretory pathway pseudopilin PulG
MNKKGFTLIELLIYAAAFVIVTTLLTSFVFSLIKAQAKIRISKEVIDNSQRAMDIMLWEIRHAQDIYAPTSFFDSHPGQLSLKTKQNTPLDEETTYLDFYLDVDNRLCLKREGNEAIPLTSEKIKINNLVFNYLTASSSQSIRIELSAVYNQATATLISSAGLRND